MRFLDIAALLGLLLLAGCVTHEKQLGTQAGLAQGKGLAVMTVSLNGRPTWPTEWRLQPPAFSALLLDGEGDTDRWASVVLRQMYGTMTTAVFVSEVQSGRYTFDAFRTVVSSDTTSGTTFYTYTWPLPRELGGFAVHDGEVTYLGNLVFEERYPGKEEFQLALERNATIEAEVLKGLLPKVAATAAVADAGWDAQTAALLAARRPEMAARSQLLLNPRRLADGSILGGSSLGQVLWRSAQGQWRRLDTGASFQVRSAVQLPDGRLLAGGEMGRLLVGSRDGREWRNAGNPVPFGVVEWLDAQPDGSLLAVVLQNKQTLLLSSTSPDAGASWRELARITHEAFGPHTGLIGQADRCVVQRAGDLVLLEHQPGRLDVFDLRTRTLRHATKLTMMPHRVANASATPDGAVHALMRDGADEALGMSVDRGVTWSARTLGTPTTEIVRVHFTTAQQGFRLVRNADQGFLSKAYVRVQTTADGGKTWASGQNLPNLHYYWQLGPTEFLANATPLDGNELWWTRDAGRTWTSERIPDTPLSAPRP